MMRGDQYNEDTCHFYLAMTLQDIENQALQLSERDRWQLVQSLLESLRRDTTSDNKAHDILASLNTIYSQEPSEIDPALAQAQFAALSREDW
jgi:hypothetical protein